MSYTLGTMLFVLGLILALMALQYAFVVTIDAFKKIRKNRED